MMRMIYFIFILVIFWGVFEVVYGLNWVFLKFFYLIIY